MRKAAISRSKRKKRSRDMSSIRRQRRGERARIIEQMVQTNVRGYQSRVPSIDAMTASP
jgi:hypothetical protein